MVASRASVHQSIATWTAILAAAVAVAGVVFTAGDAKQTLTAQGTTLERDDRRITALEGDVSNMKATLARIDQASADTRDTVHRLERGHVYHRSDD